ncbi:aldo/keto reductase [Photobacterium sp. DNB23_23_1]
MEYKQIRDMQVSSLGFGCWAMGGTWNNIRDDLSILTVKKAIEMGINFFDTAPIYGKGHSEIVLGKALKNESRDSIFIATKCGLPWDPVTRKSRKDLSAKSIKAEVDDSLQRLQTDYIDLYQVHWPDPNTSIQESAEALKELQKEGKIRHVGVSNYSIDMINEMTPIVDVVSMQGLYNLIEQNPEHYHNIPLEYRARDEMLPFCEKNGLSYLPYSPLMQGLLTGKFKESKNFDDKDDRAANPKLNGELYLKYYHCAEKLRELSEASGTPLNHLAIRWLVNQKVIGPVIAGAHTPDQVAANATFTNSIVDENVLVEAERIVQELDQ